MSDYDDNDDNDTTDDTPTVTALRRQITKLEKRVKDYGDAEAKIAAAERRAAFAEAGIPSGGLADYFRKGYEGEMTADAIRKAAADAGLTGTAAAADDPDRAAHEQIADASAGANERTSSDDYASELANARTQEEAYAVMRRHSVVFADGD